MIGERWVKEAGIKEWADTNKLVVIYPDTIASSAPGPTNPNACFDWWGYSNQYDPNYALKSGLQMTVLYAMVQRVTGRPQRLRLAPPQMRTTGCGHRIRCAGARSRTPLRTVRPRRSGRTRPL